MVHFSVTAGYCLFMAAWIDIGCHRLWLVTVGHNRIGWLQEVTVGCNRLQLVTAGYNRLRLVTIGYYGWLQQVTSDYKQLVTIGYGGWLQ